MLTKDNHYGGTLYSDQPTTTLTWASPRVVRFNASSGGPYSLTLPPLSGIRSDMQCTGRPRFIVLNTSASNLTISLADQVLAAGEWSMLSLNGEPRWVSSATGTINAAMSSSTHRDVDVTDPVAAETFDSFCAFDDFCEYLSTDGNVPLIGANEVVAPFYQDVTVHARNSTRDAIRARDVIMPTKIGVELADGDFSHDVLHPLYGSYSLSVHFFDALHNRVTDGGGSTPGPKPHILNFDSAVASTSGNWHHIVREDNAWKHGDGSTDLVANKYRWTKTVQYGPPSNPTAYSLVIVFGLEHTFTGGDVLAAGAANGPTGISGTPQDQGMWGSLFWLAVFTNEVSPAFADNSTAFTPAGWVNDFTFDRDDPAISGLCNQCRDTETVDPETKRAIHPQCVIFAHLPTTYHAPCGTMAVGQANAEFTKTFAGANTSPGRHLERCAEVPNGAPWLDLSGCADTFPCSDGVPTNQWGIFENVVFGTPLGSAPQFGKAMSLGGDMLVSAPMQWLCFENTPAGSGITFLKPTRPGWSQDCGSLDIPGGTSGRVWICTSDGDCPLGTAACGENGEWPLVPGIGCCDGHPAEKYNGVGGSHTCFRTSSEPQLCTGADTVDGCLQPSTTNTTCCIPTDGSATGKAYEFCTRSSVTFGGFDGTPCSIAASKCENTRVFFTQFTMPLTNYTFAGNITFDAGADGRLMGWARVLPDPLKPLRVWTYDDADADLVDLLGTSNRAASYVEITAVSGADVIRAHVAYDKDYGVDPWEWFGADISCTFNSVTTKAHGIGMLSPSRNGYGLNVYKSGSDLIAQVCRYYGNGASKEVLATHTFTGMGAIATGVARFFQQGHDILAWYTPTGEAAFAFDLVQDGRAFTFARDPDLYDPRVDSASDLLPSLYTEESSSGARFNATVDPMVEDIVPRFRLHRGHIGRTIAYAIYDETLYSGYGECEGNSPNFAECGEWIDTPGGGFNCNCERWSDTRHYETIANHPGTMDIVANQNFGNCGASDLPCDPFVTNEEPTYHGRSGQATCSCEGRTNITNVAVCDVCPPSDRPWLQFSIPIKSACYDPPSDPHCLGTTPLLCYGLDLYAIRIIE